MHQAHPRPAAPEQFQPGQQVNWIRPCGPRHNIRRRSAWAGVSQTIPAVVKAVSGSSVTIEAQGVERKVERRQLEVL